MGHDLGKLGLKELLRGMMHLLRRLDLKLRKTAVLPAALLNYLSATSVSLEASLRILRRGKRPRRRTRRERAQPAQVVSDPAPWTSEVPAPIQQP
jgi:hypothetical protein